jgi:hypothetical protein
MTTYSIRQTSPTLWVISLLLTIFTGMGLAIALAANGLLPKGQMWLFIVIIAPFFLLAFKIPRYTATVDIEIIIDEYGLKKRWLKQFLFQNRPDIEIKWTEVQDYVFEPDRQFDKFKMTLKNGTKFKFFHNNDYNDKDEFLTFLRHFEQKINQINSDKDTTNDIKRGKTIYVTKWGLVLAGFAIVMMIAFPVILIFFPAKKTPNYAAIGASYVGAIFYLTQVILHRQKSKSDGK